MPHNSEVFEPIGKWNVIKFQEICHTFEPKLLKFCYKWEIPIKSTNKQFKKLYLYYFILAILKFYKENFYLPNKLLVFTHTYSSKLFKNHWNDYEYFQFIRGILNKLNNNLPLNIVFLPDDNIDGRIDLIKTKKSISIKKIDKFIKNNNLEKISDKIYSIIISI